MQNTFFYKALILIRIKIRLIRGSYGSSLISFIGNIDEILVEMFKHLWFIKIMFNISFFELITKSKFISERPIRIRTIISLWDVFRIKLPWVVTDIYISEMYNLSKVLKLAYFRIITLELATSVVNNTTIATSYHSTSLFLSFSSNSSLLDSTSLKNLT